MAKPNVAQLLKGWLRFLRSPKREIVITLDNETTEHLERGGLFEDFHPSGLQDSLNRAFLAPAREAAATVSPATKVIRLVARIAAGAVRLVKA